MARQRADEVTIVGVASRDQVAAMQEFVTRHDLGHVDHVADVDGEVWAANGVSYQPAWVFVDGETGETTPAFGGLGVDGLNAQIDTLTG